MFRSPQLSAHEPFTPGGGASPASGGSEQRATPPATDSGSPDHSSHGDETRPRLTRVLVVEDDEAMADYIAVSLSLPAVTGMLGTFEVERVSTMKAARTEYARAPHDVIIMDLGLPDTTDALESVRESSQWQPNPCVVVLTANAQPGLGVDALRHGANDFLMKDDLKPRTLARSVRHAVERHRRMLRQAADAAALTRRIEDLDAYVGAISHDLRGPMSTAESMVAVLRSRRSELPEAQLDALIQGIGNQVEKARRFADELLADARGGTERRVALDLEGIVALAVDIASVPADVAVEIGSLPDGLWGRSGAVTQVLANLVRNAAAFADRSSPRVRVYGERLTTTVRLYVDDNGPGVALADRLHVFEPSFTRRAGGSGLGLAAVHRHVRGHGGQVWVETAPELGGARFIVELPVRVRARTT